jgi:hypothetical protein
VRRRWRFVLIAAIGLAAVTTLVAFTLERPRASLGRLHVVYRFNMPAGHDTTWDCTYVSDSGPAVREELVRLFPEADGWVVHDNANSSAGYFEPSVARADGVIAITYALASNGLPHMPDAHAIITVQHSTGPVEKLWFFFSKHILRRNLGPSS